MFTKRIILLYLILPEFSFPDVEDATWAFVGLNKFCETIGQNSPLHSFDSKNKGDNNFSVVDTVGCMV